MITDLWIENFKGIGKRQHIPLRPITLLFGRNSAETAAFDLVGEPFVIESSR